MGIDVKSEDRIRMWYELGMSLEANVWTSTVSWYWSKESFFEGGEHKLGEWYERSWAEQHISHNGPYTKVIHVWRNITASLKW